MLFVQLHCLLCLCIIFDHDVGEVDDVSNMDDAEEHASVQLAE